MVAVQAYFDHNEMVNLPAAYFHDSLDLMRPSHDPMKELKRYSPEYAVVTCWTNCNAVLRNNIDPFFRQAGFAMAHFSDGYLLDKGTWDVRQAYVVYRRR